MDLYNGAADPISISAFIESEQRMAIIRKNDDGFFTAFVENLIAGLGTQPSEVDTCTAWEKSALFFAAGDCGIFFPGRSRFVKVVDQIHFIGAKSVFVITLTGAFTGMVLGLAGLLYPGQVRFGRPPGGAGRPDPDPGTRAGINGDYDRRPGRICNGGPKSASCA